MSSDSTKPHRTIPSLVHYCRRVAAAHVDAFESLGDGVSFTLVQPILEACSADTLQRLEDASPHLKKDTNDLWQLHFYREFVVVADAYTSGDLPVPESWRGLFFHHRAEKERKYQEISARLKSQRLEEEERKKQKEIKLTDRVPPMKRARPWGATQQKSLFQKTRSEASKVQRAMFEPRMRPPMPTVPAKRPLVQEPDAVPSSRASGTRVVVRPIPQRRPSPVSSTPSKLGLTDHTHNPPPKPQNPPPLPPAARVPQPSVDAKKDPARSLFMPKHRAHSQLTGRLVPSRASSTK
ncbi:RNA polymerase II transcription factor SIII subunit A-domain-containing protein [Gloeopeniophorella convolvens]|nr:RNA polymerase II transcription factor SIII subunit A-domain-containing protein [Gloeopeniophorella convolvens]